ncbi:MULTISPECIES: LysR family transcriptional regulator [unclassified Shewanella]|uniref:LysR family transcriptional regulator n=1 Tax=unclassified Shewanella TaxID=196818 RepID=UPI000C84F758|nr:MULTISPECIES: LysR family transcriptional regulator [unclassified Shewanella]MDO6620660.1 LysR family transcriptional regulator [Shewanella sp. 6_MG-2023]MDO6641692.1 LysR family transcriptional regulator [Shewanella sp. 5_MG-2023]MDO6677938.1 LysR family transcriptional regulator [Shewanella sp. 4_MG-2023]MDO6777045.1 LysR family transcriptional regulator [Shewanella sp. 3_MG-2023]PMG27121.1 LysR family transcriptional regulator [Shewanella sp. 10N.286.52.C2]
MNISIKNLQCFLTVIEVGHFTLAAEQLYMTQPTLSKTIKKMEQTLDQTLLIRNNQKVEVTEAGLLLAKSAQQIVGQWNRMYEDMNALTGLRIGRLRLGLSPMTGGMFINMLASFTRTYPGIDVNVLEVGGVAVEKALLNDSLDIGVTALPCSNTDEFNILQLQSYPLNVCVHVEHELANHSCIHWQDLTGLPFVQYNDQFSIGKVISQSCQDAGFKLNVVSQTGQWEFMAAMAKAKMAFAILPAPICKRVTSKKLIFIPLAEQVAWELAFIWRKNLPLTAAAAAFIAQAKPSYKEDS